jgi:hypothetical protein
MDWDTGFLADPKYQHLKDLLPDPIQFGYAGFCHLRLVSDAWRTTQRRPIRTVVRGIETWAFDALSEAGFLDDGGYLTQESYDKWIGAALQGRVAQADRAARHRQSRDITVTHGDSVSPTVSESVARTGRVGPVEQVGPVEGVQGEEIDLFAFLAQQGAFIRPDSGFGIRLLGLIDRRGPELVLEKAKAMVTSESLSDRQWVFGLEKALEAIPSPPMDELPTANDEKSKRIYDRMQERRLEYFRQTQKWPDEWGPAPVAA